MRRLADACPNLIGFKDGHGNVEQLTCLRDTLGDRLVYVGGMPTAEVFAAIHSGDRAFASGAVRSFFIPYLALRNQRRGHALSIVKAGLRVLGLPAGPLRAPLLDLTADQEAALAGLVARAMAALSRPAKAATPANAALQND
jgi:5-dehydro-4-deoxyglucarate dehydratase